MERRSFSMQVTKLASASLGRMKATTLRCTASQTSDAEVSAFTLRYGNWLTLDRHSRIVATGRVDPGIGRSAPGRALRRTHRATAAQHIHRKTGTLQCGTKIAKRLPSNALPLTALRLSLIESPHTLRFAGMIVRTLIHGHDTGVDRARVNHPDQVWRQEPNSDAIDS